MQDMQERMTALDGSVRGKETQMADALLRAALSDEKVAATEAALSVRTEQCSIG